MSLNNSLPRFFRVQQSFPRPQLADVAGRVNEQLAAICGDPAQWTGKSIAITVGSRGVHGIDHITKACVDYFINAGAHPFIVPAMGSHGGATAEGQAAVLDRFGINPQTMNCPIRSSMEVVQVCTAKEGFPVYFDRLASEADGVLVVNRIKPHTRFAGDIESGLMKMMLIGLGKQLGAETYHRVIVNHSFDQIVRSVAHEVVSRCRILGGLAVLENGYEETADIVALPATDIERREPELLRQVKSWMPKLPFDRSELLVIDRIGKDISGTGMDTNIIGRKRNDHAAIDGDSPDIHNIYVRSLTPATHGNASGIGLAELCHQRVIDALDREATRMNCITAGHLTGAMLPIEFASDQLALSTACHLAGFGPPAQVTAMWIRDTLSLGEIECSEYFFQQAQERSDLQILATPSPLEFDAQGNLVERF
ncbi:lactate racemase domain-containing protein [Aureliella helgolandensis]|uniref:LarA-like N-terminal domain-containing protein n=1 Tax=Aureliella helgolandensis TaxID=2527968 RepID=A0A518GAK0_9BACT|nr:lactate racemase domain-containing protein [Aureliella helgolandensis]QDV25626.1 hypothetical protein Q31a_39520 [Aureliella helgolandensis]